MQNMIFFGGSTDPYENLAVEELLFDSHDEGCIFYLWQNQNTVVIGKNQNAWKECRVNLLEQEGGSLARRSSGGGAVFHDLGNLNFTFIVARESYDVARQLSVIQQACKSFDIDAQFTGRNDLVANGAKFSGNAFKFTQDTGMHHGTVLVDVDMSRLTRYLAPPMDKLSAKGVESVRARVVNLKELNKSITVESMKHALVDAFIHCYGPSRMGRTASLDKAKLNATREKYASWEWRFGSTPKFDITLERRFGFGGVELQLSLKQGHIDEMNAYSDAMDETLIERIPKALKGSAFSSKEMAAKIRALGGGQAEEIAAWIEEKGI